MDLPDLKKLFEKWESAQSKDPLPGGYVAVIRDDGINPIPFCTDDMEEWKELWPAILFSDALLASDYKIYEDYEQEIWEELVKQYRYFSAVEWNKEDFNRFASLDFISSSGLEVTFCGSIADWIVEIAQEMRNNI